VRDAAYGALLRLAAAPEASERERGTSQVDWVPIWLNRVGLGTIVGLAFKLTPTRWRFSALARQFDR